MSFKTYDVDTHHRYNGKNWLGSEVAYVAKTITVPASAPAVEENGRKVVKSGTIFTSPYYGLLVDDIDVTDGDAVAALMIGGRYIDANLPSTAASYVDRFVKQGLYAIVEGEMVRPDFGEEVALAKLVIGTPSASGANISWTAVTNAVGYEIYKAAAANGNYKKVAEVNAAPYTAKESGYYKVKAIGNHLEHADSELSSAVNVTVAG